MTTPDEHAREIVNLIPEYSHKYFHLLGPAIAQALREARSEALEEAAKECDEYTLRWQADPTSGSNGADICARNIRALKSEVK